MGKGAIPREEPHGLFTIGMQGRDHASAALNASDVVIAVGYDLVEYAPSHWNKRGGKIIVHIDYQCDEPNTCPVSNGFCSMVSMA